MNKTSLILPVLILFVLFLVLRPQRRDPALDSKTHHELCDDWFNSEQTEEDAATPFTYLGLDGKLERGWTFAEEVDQYCKGLKGSTEEF